MSNKQTIERFRNRNVKPTHPIAVNLHIEQEEDEFDEEYDEETIFIEAIAEVIVPFGDHSIIQRIHSGGIGHVFPSNGEEIEEYQKEEMEGLKEILKTMKIEVKE